MSELLPRAWKNGEICDVDAIGPSIASISFHMGTGVFDGMMAYRTEHGHNIFRGREHFERFQSSSHNMGLRFQWSVDQLLDAAAKIVACEQHRTCYIRPIAYRGGPELWLTGSERRPVDVAMFAIPLTTTTLGVPMTCDISDVQRVSSAAMPIRWKVCGLYANSFMARRRAEAAGFDDAVMMDSHGCLAEASAANLFLLFDGGIATPSLDGDVFSGLTRQTVLEICAGLGLPCLESKLQLDQLNLASGGFLCSTLMEIRPISRLQDRALSTLSDPRFHAIIDGFARLTRR